MSERIFLFLVGLTILLSLYFEVEYAIYGLCLWLLFEGVTDIRLTRMLQRVRKVQLESGLVSFMGKDRFTMDAMRAWRITVAFVLGSSFMMVEQYDLDLLWFFPWFMGFAIMGAGASSVCPMALFLRWLGFRWAA